jgi:menaquinol-cytochrome c reductase iron-sulfur subunit
MTPDQPAKPSRRHFYYLTFIYGLQALMAATLSVPAFMYLFLPPRAKKREQWVDAADLTQLPTGTPQEVSFRMNKVDGWKVSSEKTTAWVVKTADNQAVAFAPQCTHLGCAYHWDESTKHFVCPCHTSAFAIDGRVLSGPAPRPLDRYQVRIAGNELQIGPVAPHV